MERTVATTIDSAGRVVIPKAIRERAGLYAGARVEVSVDDEGIRIAPQVNPPVLEQRGRLLVVLCPAGTSIDDKTVEAVREEIAQERARATVGSEAD